MTKKTIRRFTLAIPNGSKKQLIRTYVRAVDGTDHPVDQEIDVPDFKSEVVEFESATITEQEVLSKQPPGTLCVGTQDFVTITD
jgi:hypothetical protein